MRTACEDGRLWCLLMARYLRGYRTIPSLQGETHGTQIIRSRASLQDMNQLVFLASPE